MLRDKGNKVSREDIDILDRHGVIIKESIQKVMIREDGEGAAKLWVITDKGWLYIY